MGSTGMGCRGTLGSGRGRVREGAGKGFLTVDSLVWASLDWLEQRQRIDLVCLYLALDDQGRWGRPWCKTS